MAKTDRFVIEHRPEESRYALLDTEARGDSVIGEESFLDILSEARLERVMYHTGVSEAYAGQGLASVLVRAAIEHASSEGYAVVPVCPYVKTWLKKHPDVSVQVVEPTPDHLTVLAAGSSRGSAQQA